jgi:hypothetical protein
MGTDGAAVGATGARGGEAPDDEELRDDELSPPPPEELKREVTDAVEAAMAAARTVPKPIGVDAAAKRVSSHSEI